MVEVKTLGEQIRLILKDYTTTNWGGREYFIEWFDPNGKDKSKCPEECFNRIMEVIENNPIVIRSKQW